MYTFAPSASSLLYTSHHIARRVVAPAGWWRRRARGRAAAVGLGARPRAAPRRAARGVEEPTGRGRRPHISNLDACPDHSMNHSARGYSLGANWLAGLGRPHPLHRAAEASASEPIVIAIAEFEYAKYTQTRKRTNEVYTHTHTQKEMCALHVDSSIPDDETRVYPGRRVAVVRYTRAVHCYCNPPATTRKRSTCTNYGHQHHRRRCRPGNA